MINEFFCLIRQTRSGERFALTIGWFLLLLVIAAGMVYAQGTILNTKHDLATARVALCTQCHIPHYVPVPKLWARVPRVAASGLQALCFSCHDGTVTNKGWFVFDTMNYNTHKGHPGIKGLDCDLCHDPHAADWKFLSTGDKDAGLCGSCHWTGDNTHASDVSAEKSLPIDAVWNPYGLPPDFSGTRLWKPDAITPNETGFIKCLTCHTPHGAVKDSKLNSMRYRGDKTNPLCLNCHS